MKITNGKARSYVITTLMILAIALTSFCSLNLMHRAFADSNWLAGWEYRKSYTVGPVAGAGVGYQVEIFVYSGVGSDSEQSVYLNGKGLANYGDVRFTTSDMHTLLSYWIQEVDSDHAIFWVKITDDLGSAASTIYMYYGNTSASTTSNGDNTFIFFDNFATESAVDSNKWIAGGSPLSIVSGELYLQGKSNRGSIDSKTTFGVNSAVHTRVRIDQASSYLVHFCSMRDAPGDWSERAGDLYTEGTYSGSYQTVDGAVSPIIGVALGDWVSSHTYIAAWTSSESSIYQDGVLKGTLTTGIPSVNMGVVFCASAYATPDDAYVDWCFVSQWVGSAPLIGSWGSEETCTLYTSPNSIIRNSGDVGTTFTADIDIVNVQGLFGFDINLTWDNSLITLTQVVYSTNLDTIWGSNGWSALIHQSGVSSDGGTGWYKLVATSTSSSFYDGVIPNSLVTLTFLVKGINFDRTTLLHLATHKLGAVDSSPILHTAEDGHYEFRGVVPLLSMTPTSVMEFKKGIGGQFTIDLAIDNEFGVTGIAFDVSYPNSLLKYDGFALGAQFTGTVTENGGIITVDISPSAPISGPATLVTITFEPNYDHVWKTSAITPPWTNDALGSIFYQTATLTYQSGGPLSYDRAGTPPQPISVGSDVTYRWHPIKGDVNLDGIVSVLDLSTIAYYYDVTPNSNPAAWSNGNQRCDLTQIGTDQVIDIFDLIVVASNFNANSPTP